MASLETLPADQRAVLQLVLQRGRSYDDIARLLSIDRAAVRQRALTALDALGPQTGVPDQRRALITDYLLGQLPERVHGQTRARLAQSPSERAWARVLASELAPLAANPLPDIPTEALDDRRGRLRGRSLDAPAPAPAADEPLLVPATWPDEPESPAAPVAATAPSDSVRTQVRPPPRPPSRPRRSPRRRRPEACPPETNPPRGGERARVPAHGGEG